MKSFVALITVAAFLVAYVTQIGNKNNRLAKSRQAIQNREREALLAKCISDVGKVLDAVVEKVGPAGEHVLYGKDSPKGLTERLALWSKENGPKKREKFDQLFFATRMSMADAMRAYEALCRCSPNATQADLEIALKERGKILCPQGWVDWCESQHRKLDRIEGVKLLGNN